MSLAHSGQLRAEQKEHSSGVQRNWVQIPVAWASAVALNKVFFLSEPRLPHLSMWIMPPTYGVVVGIYIIDVKSGAHSKFSVNYGHFACEGNDRIIRIHRFSFALCVLLLTSISS